MAGDWIKLECTTPDKPEIVAMAAALRIDQDAVVGKLIRVWIWADHNSIDGNAVNVTTAFLDRHTHKPGFAAAMRSVGWLEGDNGSLTFPGFSRHNGRTAKARAETNRRVSKHRTRNEDVTPEPLQKPLPEKRRVQSSDERESTAQARDPVSVHAETIALAYPRQDAPMEVMAIIADDLNANQDAEQMRLAVQTCANFIRKAPGGSGNRYVPSARTFFLERQWLSPEAFQSRWTPDLAPNSHAAKRAEREIPSTSTAASLKRL